MLWKMWTHYGDIPLVVEADTLDEAMRAARRVHPDYCTAQPMDDREAAEFMEGMHRVEGALTAPCGWEWWARGSAFDGTRRHYLKLV